MPLIEEKTFESLLLGSIIKFQSCSKVSFFEA